ncbi:hypothetical protein N0V93_002729 [Gnomoniopsis smithogilvyi]|uniref:Kelch repeat-containing protein n=1 Tax=Gnomoniopsis smithogilvyi TaxID=1191159 RepID=A0A9W8YZ61_9PEZI|nr:hypothetical protein N0V93_002729 [Gnomoniopsis smithogilvyi]
MHILGHSFLPMLLCTNAFLCTALGFAHSTPRAPSVADGIWQILAPIPVAPRQEQVTVAINSTTIAIIGGIVPDLSNSNGTISNSTGFTTTNIVQLYDIPSDTWTSASPAPVEINHANAGVVDGKIYLLGGLVFTPTGQSDQGSWIAIADAWVYDPFTDEWTVIEGAPELLARGASVVGVYGSRVYLAGGLQLLDLLPVTGAQDSVANVTAFDTASGTWVSDLPVAAQQLPEARDHAVGAVVGSTFYVIGGRNQGQTNVKDTVFALDLEDLEAGWRTSDARMPTARGGLSAGTVGTQVFTFGGEGNVAVSTGVFNETEVFDTVTETWTKLLPMRLARHGTSAVGVGDRIYVPGGGTVQGATPVDVLDVYIP